MADYPAEFLSDMARLLGGEYPAFAEALRQPPTRALRLNPAKPCRIRGEGVAWEPDGIYVGEDLRPGGDAAHFAGAYYMQEASAMAPARALSVQPGELVLDLCAAPGGKSGQLAAALCGDGVLISNEIDKARAKALGSNLERLGVRNALVTGAPPARLAGFWPGAFDAILVDAPCSGEGMFRRDPASREQWNPGSPEGCASRQAVILDDAARMLKPGGRMVYSSCTFNESENEGVVRGFLRGHPDFSPADFELPGAGASSDGMLRLWPHRVRGEGQFMALLRRTGEPPAQKTACPSKPSEAARDVLARLIELLAPGEWSEALQDRALVLINDRLWAMPRPMVPLFEAARPVVLRPGLCLCEVGKGFVKPDHALAMALSPRDMAQSIELSADDVRRFLRGHELPCPESGSGWTLAAHQGLSVGWGKAVQGTLKNHIPKGLRLH